MRAAAAAPWATALLGRTLASRYEVVRFVGSGGMGAVFEARHVATSRRVALKVLRPEHRGDESIVERFHREARAAAACARSGVVEVIDLDRDPACGPFLVMDLLEGETLGARIAREGAMSPVATCVLGAGILETLAAVHARGILHRDLKPENVWLERTERGEHPRLLDFGLARDPERRPGHALTLPGAAMGTPRYMAPEQALGDPSIDARADLYSVGAILYCCLAGEPPHAEASDESVLHATVLEPPCPLAELRPDVPPSLGALVDRAVARARDARWQSATEMRDALLDVLASLDPSERMPERSSPATARAAETSWAHASTLPVPETPARAPPKTTDVAAAAAEKAPPRAETPALPSAWPVVTLTVVGVLGAVVALVWWIVHPRLSPSDPGPPTTIVAPSPSPDAPVAPSPTSASGSAPPIVGAPLPYAIAPGLPYWSDSYAPARMSDSDPRTYWCTAMGPTFPLTATLLLVAPREVRGIVLDNRLSSYETSGVRDVTVSALDDGGTVRATATATLPRGAATYVPLPRTVVTSRIVVSFASNHGGAYAGLAELSIW